MKNPNIDDLMTQEEIGKKPYFSPRLIHHGLVRELTASGSDANGDTLTYATIDLPAFATLTDHGDRTARGGRGMSDLGRW